MKITITVDDVRKAGSVREALIAYCEGSVGVACGVIGPMFATSGPGYGWSIQYDELDYAKRAMEEGAIYYLDVDDGRLASSPEWTDDVYGGQPIEWSDESVVELEAPCIEDAINNHVLVEQMAAEVIDNHYAESDVSEWIDLIGKIKAATDSFDNIRLADLERCLPE